MTTAFGNRHAAGDAVAAHGSNTPVVDRLARICVIFDLDGTLVDSEGLCNQAFLDLLPQLNDTVECMVKRYRGRRLAWILADIETRLDKPLAEDFVHEYRERVTELFSANLRPTLGTREMLQMLRRPCCIATGEPVEKIKQALHTSGLSRFFDDRIFSSYEVKSWKPAPELFLHAAKMMGFPPSECVVVEDSEVGIEAAAAGMHALHYAPTVWTNLPRVLPAWPNYRGYWINFRRAS